MIFAGASFNHHSTHSVARRLAALVLAVVAVGFGGCTSLSVKRDLDTIVTMAPAPVMVKAGQELRAAEAAAQQIEGAQAFLGVGESMQPIYASGTAIVVMPCEYSQLRAGMSVVYVNRTGRGVAHVLINEMPTGWIAQGVNNPAEDADLVTASNLVGVISQAYASVDTPMRREIASRIAQKNARPLLALNCSKAGTPAMAVAYQGGTN